MKASVTPVLRILFRETCRGRYATAPVYLAFEKEDSPFLKLIGCLVSQRVRDEQTAKICAGIFAEASTPEEMLALPLTRLEELLYGAGFYRQKARHIHGIARAVLERGGVPGTREELVELPGIGPKCANIILASCFGKPAIAVDTHVHRISNRIGWVGTKTPEKTEVALTPLVPTRWRRRVNVLLVAHGQLVCRPIGPLCEACAIEAHCEKRGVTRTRRK